MKREFISLGAGVQSSTLFLMAVHGEIEPLPEAALFADTGWERPETYRQIEFLKETGGDRIEIVTLKAGNIREDILKGTFNPMPVYVKDPAHPDREKKLPRQCTYNYKVRPIYTWLRERTGRVQYSPYGESVRLWIGISLDEVIRMKPARVKWVENRWPLIEKKMTRTDCIRWLKEHGYPIPAKSACIGCPFHSRQAWPEFIRDEKAREEAIELDEHIRHMGVPEGMECYLHTARIPVRMVGKLHTSEPELDLEFGEECEGMCGI